MRLRSPINELLVRKGFFLRLFTLLQSLICSYTSHVLHLSRLKSPVARPTCRPRSIQEAQLTLLARFIIAQSSLPKVTGDDGRGVDGFIPVHARADQPPVIGVWMPARSHRGCHGLITFAGNHHLSQESPESAAAIHEQFTPFQSSKLDEVLSLVPRV